MNLMAKYRETPRQILDAVKVGGMMTVQDIVRVIHGTIPSSRDLDNALYRVRVKAKKLVAEGKLLSAMRRRYDAQSRYTKWGIEGASCKRDYLMFTDLEFASKRDD